MRSGLAIPCPRQQFRPWAADCLCVTTLSHKQNLRTTSGCRTSLRTYFAVHARCTGLLSRVVTKTVPILVDQESALQS